MTLLILVTTLWAVGLATDVTLTEEHQQEVVQLHNDARLLEPASNMATMSWDSDLALKAQQWTDACHFEHQTEPSWGENLAAKTYRSGSDVTALLGDMFHLWTDEKVHNPNGTFECCGMSSYQCCHYTQVVWAESTKVGCGLTLCDPLTTKTDSIDSVLYLACYYTPRGNVPKATYTWDWRPYIILE